MDILGRFAVQRDGVAELTAILGPSTRILSLELVRCRSSELGTITFHFKALVTDEGVAGYVRGRPISQPRDSALGWNLA